MAKKSPWEQMIASKMAAVKRAMQAPKAFHLWAHGELVNSYRTLEAAMNGAKGLPPLTAWAIREGRTVVVRGVAQ